MSGKLTVAILAVLLLLGCVTSPPVQIESDEETSLNELIDEPVEVVDEPVEVVVVSDREPEPIAEPEPDPELESPVDSIGEGEPAPIEVSEEQYDQAFGEVEALIEELNRIIYGGDYDAWLEYLTDDYIRWNSDPEVLAAASEQPVLKQNGIVLRDLEDYFEFVVVPSRARAQLDGLVFYSDTLVEAVSLFRGELAILYLLREIDGAWKIDTF